MPRVTTHHSRAHIRFRTIPHVHCFDVLLVFDVLWLCFVQVSYSHERDSRHGELWRVFRAVGEPVGDQLCHVVSIQQKLLEGAKHG